MDIADTVAEMVKIRHPLDRGRQGHRYGMLVTGLTKRAGTIYEQCASNDVRAVVGAAF